jgi:hypothetical protein
MTDFYALRRYPRSVDWEMVWLWGAIIVFGAVEFGFAVYGLIAFLRK